VIAVKRRVKAQVGHGRFDEGGPPGENGKNEGGKAEGWKTRFHQHRARLTRTGGTNKHVRAEPKGRLHGRGLRKKGGAPQKGGDHH